MARPIDYSKWDNMDTGSSDEGEPSAPPAGAAGGPANPAAGDDDLLGYDSFHEIPSGVPIVVTGTSTSATTRPANAPAPGVYSGYDRQDVPPFPANIPRPPAVPNADEVLATYAPCKGDTSCRGLRATSVPETHPVFSQGAVSPVAALVGLPLRVHRTDTRLSLRIPRSATYDNQRATFMMIAPRTGFAGPEWQQGVGSVILARGDRRPLPPQHAEAFLDFCSRLLDMFGNEEPVDPAVEMTPAKWQASGVAAGVVASGAVWGTAFFLAYQRRHARADPIWAHVTLPWEA
ncbi:hypothetical protein HYH03_005764 [Edaphochlamys debaryana]|uniref:Uncharacterized protein n=1 Tax=Edaphochlamys debaryana TaxID=47281 RepID=A0A835Y6V8_9CHLO|nr:hypothetical protein HYH03_005764 [Edaphochlamys debaryana]|eukprot:KAG2496162.1 hypothetical protein HYH03_005764 [Edaphochlamys debaryana]